MRSSVIWGIIIVLIGLGLLLNNLGITNIEIGEIIATYWPTIFIIWGLETIINKNSRKFKSNFIFGVIMILLGFSIIGRNLNLFDFDFSLLWNMLWPLILIFIGIGILKAGTITKNNWAIMGGIERRNDWKLSDQSYIALMGGIDLDLTVADIPEGETYLELTVIMGGIEIKAPNDTDIICKNTTLLGGIDFFHEDDGGIYMNKEFKHKANVETKKKIFINSHCILGGIEIR